jgi:hypothetical protein
LKVTEVAPLRCVPVTATVVAGGPLFGVKLVIVGAGGVTVKLLAPPPLPPGVM